MKQRMLGCVFLLMATSAQAAPAIMVEKPVYDFGVVTQGAKVDHLFTVRNSGDQPLTISQIHTSCGCTAATLSSRTIAPGKSGEVKVTFDSTNFADQVTKTVHLDSNDPHSPSTVLTMQGKVAEIIATIPRTLNLGAIKAGSVKEAVLTLENKGSKPFAITSVSSPMSAIIGSAREGKVNPGQTGKVAVTVTAPREGRFLSGYLTIRTDNPHKPEVVVSVYATIIP